MKLSRLLSLSLTVIGGLAATRVLVRRHRWEQTNNQVGICVDYDDAWAAAIRANMSFDDMLAQLARHGATHLSLPEFTLNRLLAAGRLVPQAPPQPLTTPPPVGHWNYLHGDPALVACLAGELASRLPYTQARVLDDQTLAFAGDLHTIGPIGLGFDVQMGQRIVRQGLSIIPRPVSYDWPEKALVERTLVQAASLGNLVAFDGNMILGHEMYLAETLATMEREGLSLVYFAESRHQKGDWFVARQRAPQVVLAHQFSRQEMLSLDVQAACRNWVHLARERGIRLCYVNFFRVLHATGPLEGLHYLEQLKEALEAAGFVVTPGLGIPTPVPAPKARDLALIGLASAGVAATAVNELLQLPELLAVPLTVVAAGGALVLPALEQAPGNARETNRGRPHFRHHNGRHDHAVHSPVQAHMMAPVGLERESAVIPPPGEHPDHAHHDLELSYNHSHPNFPTSYTPKLLALAATSLAPVAALKAAERDGGVTGWGTGVLLQVAAAADLAAVLSGPAYFLRIEEYRGFNLDWLLPALVAALNIPNAPLRGGTLAALLALWGTLNRCGVDLLAQVDPDHAEGHTHHISAAQRLIGDVLLTLGPRPARKWAGLGPAANALTLVLSRWERPGWAAGAAMAGALGHGLGLVGFRRPERALMDTLRVAGPSFGVGVVVGLLALVLGRATTRPPETGTA